MKGSVEIQQEDPSENYAPTLGWSLRPFLGGGLFIDAWENYIYRWCLFIYGWENSIHRWWSIYRCMCEFNLQITCLFIDACRLLLSLNNSWII